MKDKLLFLCSDYDSPTHANSVCVKNLAEEFVKEGYDVWVMAWTKGKEKRKYAINGVQIVERKRNLFSNIIDFFKGKRGMLWSLLFKFIQASRFLYTLPFYPNVAPLDSWRLKRSACKLIEEKNISTVISTYRPYETIAAAMSLKNKYGDRLHVVTYHLDLLNSPDNTSKLVLFAKNKKHVGAFKRECEIVDRILLPNSAPKINSVKLRYVDFPVYLPSNAETNSCFSFDINKINITYVGSLDGINRNPVLFFTILSELPLVEGKEIVLHIWGKISDKELKALIEGTPHVIYHGMAQPSDVPGLLHASDLLLNVGNGITYKMIPSKIFQYFAAAKPIINLVKHKEDASLPYFEKYGYSLQVMLCDRNEDNRNSILNFVRNYNGKVISTPSSLFEESKPNFICEQIIN